MTVECLDSWRARVEDFLQDYLDGPPSPLLYKRAGELLGWAKQLRLKEKFREEARKKEKDPVYEWECKCFQGTAQDGEEVKTWLSVIGEKGSYATTYATAQDPLPLVPRPNCGKADRIRNRTLPEKLRP
jgi:hypothetical protein